MSTRGLLVMFAGAALLCLVMAIGVLVLAVRLILGLLAGDPVAVGVVVALAVGVLALAPRRPR